MIMDEGWIGGEGGGEGVPNFSHRSDTEFGQGWETDQMTTRKSRGMRGGKGGIEWRGGGVG